MTCERCRGERWICEQHPWKPFPHDACSGPGEPCPECQGEGRPELPDDWVSIASTLRPDVSRRRERVWVLRRSGKEVICELQFHGESYGWECRCLHDGELAYGQRY